MYSFIFNQGTNILKMVETGLVMLTLQCTLNLVRNILFVLLSTCIVKVYSIFILTNIYYYIYFSYYWLSSELNPKLFVHITFMLTIRQLGLVRYKKSVKTFVC